MMDEQAIPSQTDLTIFTNILSHGTHLTPHIYLFSKCFAGSSFFHSMQCTLTIFINLQ